jgi:hypothetical protein
MTAPWEHDPVYGELADAIASDRLVVYTGSGISNGLVRADGPMPAWKDLLTEVAAALPLSPDDRRDVEALINTAPVLPASASNLSPEVRRDVEALIQSKPSGAHLIEAASILEKADGRRFTELVRAKLTPAESQPADVARQQQERHGAVLALQPRGIVTLNIDRRHYQALASGGLAWEVIDPTLGDAEQKMRDWLRDPTRQRFLLEAHGSLSPESSIVFTHRAYRDLLEKNPTYRAFLANLFINYHFLFLGFGLTDLDFDELLNQTALKFGESPQHHIAVRKVERSGEEERRKVHYRRRFGLRFLDVPRYDDVWEAIRQAKSHCGPELNRSIRRCASGSLEERKQGHRALNALGPAGQSVAIRVLTKLIADPTAGSHHEKSEYIYSLKYLASGANRPDRLQAKQALFGVLEQSANVEFIAHAITALEGYLEPDDLGRLERAAKGVRQRTLTVPEGFSDPDGRVPVYLDAAILRLRASSLT